MNIPDSIRKDKDLEMTQGIFEQTGLEISCSIMTRALDPTEDEVIRTGEMWTLRCVWTLWREYYTSESS
jgi:hypothetical protein